MNRKDRRRAQSIGAQSMGAPAPSVMDPLAQAISAHNAGRLADAERIYREILRRQPDHVEALHLLGVLGHQAGHSAGGAEMIEKALALKPNHAEAHFNLGLIRRAQGQKDQARECFACALKIEPRYAEAANNLGALLKEQGDLAGAQAALEAASKARPDFLPAWLNLATVALERADVATAQRALARAKTLAKEHPSVLALEANLMVAAERPEDAIALFRRALESAPQDAEIWNGLGVACAQAFCRKDASDAFARALTLRLDYAEAHLNVSILEMDERRMDAAAEHIAAAVAIQPNNPLAHRLLGETAAARGDMAAADRHFAKALELRPDYLSAYCLWTKARLDSCSWDDWRSRAQALADMEAATPESRVQEIHPFLSLYLSDDPERHARAAARYARHLDGMKALRGLLPPQAKASDNRLRIGFFSADFRAHPVGQIVAGLFRHFDRKRFKVHAYCFGHDDGSPIRQRIAQTVDVFADVAKLSPLATAQRIREDGIDILIDLMGHTQDARPKVLALRPAPLQASWLYIGPTGMEDIDALLADPAALPQSLARHYRESIVHLDGCLLPYDTEHAVIGSQMNRAEAGLPETGAVFCSFNAPQKLEPEMFSVWMRILTRVPDATLWLLAPVPAVADNLRRQAEMRGVDPARLVFAPKLPKDQHLARHALADLFLDTRIYGAHLTALDSLWAGLPVLTCPGQGFASRIGASLLTAAGLPELIARDLKDYEEKAVALGQNATARAALKAKWEGLRAASPLFDCEGFVRRFEKTISGLWDRKGWAK